MVNNEESGQHRIKIIVEGKDKGPRTYIFVNLSKEAQGV